MTADLKPYAKYREPGMPWLGEVPQHWEVLPNRALFEEVKERDHPDEQMLSVTIASGVIRQRALLADSAKKDSSNLDKSAYKLVCPGDIAYNKMRAWQGAVGVSLLRGIVSPAYVVLRPREGAVSRYWHHLLRTAGFAREAERWSYGITSDMWSLRPEHFKMICACRPPLPEQSAIIRFVDHADRRIRRYISAKQKQVKLLEEQKQAVIHRAVTRGLDANVRLKLSGVEWLGDVPEHWEVWQVGHFGRVGNGSTPSRSNAAYWNSGDYPWLNSASVNRSPISEADQFVTELALRECHLPRVQPGSVLVAITGQGKTRGTAAVLTAEATINQHIVYVTPRREIVTPQFLQLAFVAAYRHLRSISDDSGSTKGALTCGDISHLRLPVPPADEQEQIVAATAVETRGIEATLGRVETETSLLREYRTRLVADAVTGKLDVREAAASLSDESDGPDVPDDADGLVEGDVEAGDTDCDAASEGSEA